jgi:hypothetical protein
MFQYVSYKIPTFCGRADLPFICQDRVQPSRSVSAETFREPLTTGETDMIPTPATLATSVSVGIWLALALRSSIYSNAINNFTLMDYAATMRILCHFYVSPPVSLNHP